MSNYTCPYFHGNLEKCSSTCLFIFLSQATTIMRLWNRYLAFGVVESSDKKNNCTKGENEV